MATVLEINAVVVPRVHCSLAFEFEFVFYGPVNTRPVASNYVKTIYVIMLRMVFLYSLQS